MSDTKAVDYRIWSDELYEYFCDACVHDGTKDGHCDECDDYGTFFEEKEDVKGIVSPKFLREQGFRDVHKSNLLRKRIHAMIYLEYDRGDNFIALVRKEELIKHGIEEVKITIPKKMETEQDVIDLLKAVEG